MPGPIEAAIRAHLHEGQSLSTPARRAPFVVDGINTDGIVLLLGVGKHRTPISWGCLEGIPAFLRDRDWVRIGGKFTTESDPETLDGYLKQYQKVVTAGWVAVVLDHAGVVELDRERPARIRLREAFA